MEEMEGTFLCSCAGASFAFHCDLRRVVTVSGFWFILLAFQS